ncbi:MAG: hypothetical protein GY730_08965 [bacterium]|nr:hypothetical protein [bacterium]
MINITEHLIIIVFFQICLFVYGLFTKAGRNNLLIIFTFIFIYCFKIILAWIVFYNGQTAIEGLPSSPESDTDSFYYYTIDAVNSTDEFIPKKHAFVADPAFHLLLYWVGKIYSRVFQITEIHYMQFIYFHIFMSSLLFFTLVQAVNRFRQFNKKFLIKLVFFLSVFEPFLLIYSLVLLREVEVGLIVFLMFLGFIYKRWLQFIFCFILLIFFRWEYIFLVPAILAGYFIYKVLFKKTYILYLALNLIGASFFVHILSARSIIYESIFFHHSTDVDTSGLGGFIANAPYFFRVFFYSILGFFSPVPFYPFMNHPYNTIYILPLLTGLSSISYLFFHVLIIFAYVRIRRKLKYLKLDDAEKKKLISSRNVIEKGYYFVFLFHIVFQGLIYTVRHKVQIVPVLIYLAVYSMQYYNFSYRKVSNIFKLNKFALSFFVIIMLHILYLFVKISVQ